MNKVVSYSSILRHSFLCIGMLVIGGCASRGFKLSQQMPGMDNKLNPIFAGNTAEKLERYEVTKDGSVVLKAQDQTSNRQVASSKKRSSGQQAVRLLTGLLYESPGAAFVNSTLDPQNGALLLGEGN